MDLIDFDQVLEVPDTPDRLLGPAALTKGERYRIRRESDDSVNCNNNNNNNNINYNSNNNNNNNRVAKKDYICEWNRSQREKEKLDTVKQRLFVRPDSCSKSRGFSTSKNVGQTIDAVKHDKGKALCISDVDQSTRRVGHGGYAGLTEKNTHRQSGVSSDAVPSVDCGKGVGFFHTARHKDESNASTGLKPCTTSKAPQKRMLVRNGCISPHNVAKLKNVAAKRDIVDLVEEKRSDSGAPASESRSNSIVKANIPEKRETGRLVREKQRDSGALASGSQSSVVDIKDLIAEAKDSCRYKGKGISHHPSSEDPAAESSRLSHRGLVSKKPAEKSSDYRADTPRCSAETKAQRTPHNERKQRDVGQQKIMQIGHRIGRDIEHHDDGVTQVMSPHANNLRINRQMENSASRNSGKRPISCIVDSAAEPSSSRSKRSKSVMGTSNPVSEPNSKSEDSSIRSLQIEADEMLARELQEQLYAEDPTPAVANAEMDIPLAYAMTAHQDDNAWGAGGHLSYPRRGGSISNVRGRIRPSTSRHRSSRRLPQPQPHTSTRMAQLRRNFLEHQRSTLSTPNLTNLMFLPNMHVELRLEMLEALEAAADSRMPRDLLQVGREFNEDDYEMLLSLDEDNHQHGGATRAQINNLPESVVQVETSQECAICLEIPSVGETIRHLPCLHRFHKACIDQWLGRKTSCPVCKSSIT